MSEVHVAQIPWETYPIRPCCSKPRFLGVLDGPLQDRWSHSISTAFPRCLPRCKRLASVVSNIPLGEHTGCYHRGTVRKIP